MLRTSSDIFGHLSGKNERRGAEARRRSVGFCIPSPCHLVTLSFFLDGTLRDILGHDPRAASQKPRFMPAYSIAKEHRAPAITAPNRARRARARRNKSIVHCTTPGPLRGTNMPGFSALFRCPRPGLEIGEKKDWRPSVSARRCGRGEKWFQERRFCPEPFFVLEK